MSDFILLILILVLVVCIILTVAAFVLYSGLLSEVVIKTGPPPIKNVTIAYKFKEGPYKDCGAAYTESCSIGPKLSNIAIFYDDPKQERKLSAFPYIEICSSDSIHYMVPLSRQTDFFVPEVKEEPRTDVKEEDSDEDRGTDITGNRRTCQQYAVVGAEFVPPTPNDY
uniref:Uncharacterized protein n=1 Tax=Periophthalmus magnuspinnatus TaxID=409849 RepID=A0A3B3ZNI9_9GOBI